MAMKIAYVLKTFPKLSETFILNEILELERQGLELHIFSLREPSEAKMHAGVAEVKAGVTYLRYVAPQPALHRIPFERYAQRLQRSNDRWFVFLRRPVRYLRTLVSHLRCSGRRRYFDQALGLARELLTGESTHLPSPLANEPTSVANLAHHLTGCPFSFTAHAKDIYFTGSLRPANQDGTGRFHNYRSCLHPELPGRNRGPRRSHSCVLSRCRRQPLFLRAGCPSPLLGRAAPDPQRGPVL